MRPNHSSVRLSVEVWRGMMIKQLHTTIAVIPIMEKRYGGFVGGSIVDYQTIYPLKMFKLHPMMFSIHERKQHVNDTPIRYDTVVRYILHILLLL